MKLMEAKEDLKIQELIHIMETEEDPDKKAKMKASIDKYYYLKYMDFLQEDIGKDTIKRMIKASLTEKTVLYWLEKSREKMKSMGMNTMFLLEASKFETRFLDEKYHHQDQFLLLYFLHTVAYADLNPKSGDAMKIVCMVFAIDKYIRNQWNEEDRAKVHNNILAFEDQLMGVVPNHNKVVPFPAGE